MHAFATNQPRTNGYAAIAVAAVILSILASWIVHTAGWEATWLVSAPTVAGSFGLLLRLFDRYGWRWPLLRSLGVADTPDIEGTYGGELVSTYDGTTIPVRVEIDQTWTAVAVRFEVLGVTTSTSQSLTAALDQAGRTAVRLVYTYRNAITPGVADEDMNDHDGTAELRIDTSTGQVHGRYYNFRGRQGTLTLTRQRG